MARQLEDDVHGARPGVRRPPGDERVPRAGTAASHEFSPFATDDDDRPIREAQLLCRTLAAAADDGPITTAHLTGFGAAAERWVTAGVSLDTARATVREAMRYAVDELVLTQTGADILAEALRHLVGAMPSISAVIFHAYRFQLEDYAEEQFDNARAQAFALINGHRSARGRQLAAHHVLAVHIAEDLPAGPEQLLAALSTLCDAPVLPLLTSGGGTYLIPETSVSDTLLEPVVSNAATAISASVVAVSVRAEVADIPEAYHHAAELLELAVRLNYRPGLYRFADLVVEYQLTRPGRARELLAALLAPLDPFPELIDTLVCHIHTGGIRAHTAQRLGVHSETVARRLERIHELTRCDPNKLADLGRLHAAMVARDGGGR